MAKRIELFSTREDALKLLGEVEAERPLWYARTGVYTTPTCLIYTSAIQIPDLGKTPRPNRTSSDRYMIFPVQVDVVFREVKQNIGNTLHMLDPWKNHPCLLYTCGGVYGGDNKDERCVIAGLVETAYEDAELAGLYSLFFRSIKKTYARFRRPDLDSFVGPEALTLLHSGWRFTESRSSPTTLDLKWEPEKS
jgi:hypothetical protein